MFKTNTLLGAAAGALLFALVPAGAQDAGTAAADQATANLAAPIDTPTFVNMAHSSNNFEIQSSQLAESKAEDGAVRDFAQQMIKDHTAAGERMTEVLQQAGVEPPTEDLSERHRQMVQTLQDASGQSFDPAYVQMQYQAHREAVTLFENYAENGDNETLRSFAAETLPTLQKHFAEVRELPGAPVEATGSTSTESGGGSAVTPPAPAQ